MKTDRFTITIVCGSHMIFENMPNGTGRHVTTVEDRDDARMVTKALNNHREWALALQSLTPGGSEYVDEPQRCATHVRDTMDSRWDIIKQCVIEKRKLKTALKGVSEALKDIHDDDLTLAERCIKEITKEAL